MNGWYIYQLSPRVLTQTPTELFKRVTAPAMGNDSCVGGFAFGAGDFSSSTSGRGEKSKWTEAKIPSYNHEMGYNS